MQAAYAIGRSKMMVIMQRESLTQPRRYGRNQVLHLIGRSRWMSQMKIIHVAIREMRGDYLCLIPPDGGWCDADYQKSVWHRA